MNTLLKGILYVALGSSSYGMLATIVKIAYKNGFTTAEVTFSQFTLGVFILFVLMKINKISWRNISQSHLRKLLFAGTSMGFTGVLYYLSVKYLNASFAVVLLMQSVWIGVVIESFQTKSLPDLKKVLATILVLIGTLFATNILSQNITIQWIGVVFGLLSAISFSLTLYTSNSVAVGLPTLQRSFYMLLGGLIIVTIFLLLFQILPYYFDITAINKEYIYTKPFDLKIFYTFGALLAIFGTVIPPILLNKGFPLVGVGLGSIVSSIELPISITFSYIVLKEMVVISQWFGIALILFAVFLMNYNISHRK